MDENERSRLRASADRPEITRLVNLTLRQALADEARTVEVDQVDGRGSVRFVLDRGSIDVMSPPADVMPGLFARLRMMASLDAADPGTQHGTLEFVLDSKARRIGVHSQADRLVLTPET